MAKLYQFINKEHLDEEGKMTTEQWDKFVSKYQSQFAQVCSEIAKEMFENFEEEEEEKQEEEDEDEEEEEDEEDEEEVPYCYADGKYSAPIPCGCPQLCCVPESDDEEDDESDEPLLCWNGKPCETDELGCCIVCCECKSCICRLQKEEAKLNEDKVMIIKKKPKKLKIVKSFDN
tara:strand:+ start:196 stop:720 length:525 start_codon:yes stop_codon:yes gene_type:complete